MVDLADAKNNQEDFKSYLGEIKKGNKKHKSKEQKKLCTILKCFTKQETRPLNVMMSEAKYRGTKGTGIKILTPKQML